MSGLSVAGGRRHPALLRVIRKFVFRNREGLVVVQDEVAPRLLRVVLAGARRRPLGGVGLPEREVLHGTS